MAAPPSPGQSLAWQLCSVCSSELDWPKPIKNSEDRLFAHCPRLLHCLHSVCEACLHDARERHRMFRCLECNARTAVPTVEAVNGLSFDWVAIDGVRRKAQTLGTYGCDECAEDEEATFWCESCGIGLCAFHRENHAKSRKTANHRVRQIDEDGGEAAVIGSLPDEAAAAAADDDDASDWGGYSSSDDGAAPPPPEEKREGAGVVESKGDGAPAPAPAEPAPAKPPPRPKPRARPTAPRGDVAGSDATPPSIAVDCSEHHGEEVRYFCGRCGTLACRDCAARGPHVCRAAGQTVAWEAVDGAAHRVRASAPAILKRCDDTTRALEAAIAYTDASSARVDDAAQRARTDVRDAMDAIRLAVAEREAELVARVDAYVGGAERLHNAKRATLQRAAQDVDVVRRRAVDAFDVLEHEDAQLLSVSAAVARRLGDVKQRLSQEPLRPDPIDDAALRFELPPRVPVRVLNLVAALGAVRTPDDAPVEPAPERTDAGDRPPPPPEPTLAPPVELVVHALRPTGTVGDRVNKLLKLKRAGHRGGDAADDGDWPYDARGGGGGATFNAAKQLKRSKQPDVESFVVDVQAAPERAAVDGAVLARVVVVTTTDAKLKGMIEETRRVETTTDPPTMRLHRTLALRGPPESR